MAKLIHDVMLREDNISGYTGTEIAILNFELQDVLNDLEPGSDAYMARARAFHNEVAQVASRDSLFSKLSFDHLRRIDRHPFRPHQAGR